MATKIVDGVSVTLSPEEEAAFNVERAPTLDEVKAIKLKEANQKCDEALEVITSQYSSAERETWVIQELEASNYQYDVDNLIIPRRPTPNLDWIIEFKYGLPVDDIKRQLLVTRVLGKSLAFHRLSSTTVGKRHRMTDAIEAATTKRELEEIVF